VDQYLQAFKMFCLWHFCFIVPDACIEKVITIKAQAFCGGQLETVEMETRNN